MKNEPVIFLDRDGTINEETSYLYRPEELRILPGVAEAIRLFCLTGYKIIVVTNQAGIARGYFTEQDVERLHRYLSRRMEENRAHIDAFYYCPHHPVHGIGKYRITCSCRKPGTGMLEMAADQFLIDKKRSFLIGDKLIDMEAGQAFGLRTILVGSGYGAKEHARVLFQGAKTEEAAPGITIMEKGAPYEMFAETLLAAAQVITGKREDDYG